MDGSSEDFDKEKIVKACINAGATEKDAREIAEEVSRKVEDGVTTREIRSMVLDMLEERNPEWRDNWEFYWQNNTVK